MKRAGLFARIVSCVYETAIQAQIARVRLGRQMEYLGVARFQLSVVIQSLGEFAL